MIPITKTLKAQLRKGYKSYNKMPITPILRERICLSSTPNLNTRRLANDIVNLTIDAIKNSLKTT